MRLLSSLRRSPYQTLGIVLSLSVSFTILFLFTTIIFFVTSLVTYIKTQPQVSVYFMKTTPRDEIYKIREELLKTGKTREVTYISQEKALQFYKQITKDEPILQEMASKESLPESLEVYATQPEYLMELAAFAKKQQGVESVEFQEELVGNLIKVTSGITIGLTAFLVAQLLLLFFMEFIITSFQIVRRKDEIEILRLLGASRSYVTSPLVQQSVMLTIFSIVISILIIIGFYIASYPFLKNFLYGIPSLVIFSIGSFPITVWPLSGAYFLTLALIAFITGLCITLFSAWFAARKYII